LLQTFVFRCDDRLPQITTDVRAIIAKHGPSLPIYNVFTLEHLVDEATARPRLLSRGIGVFAVLACILAGVGIYAVLSQFVAERRRDIGLRIALGARTSQVVRLVVGRALVLVAVGITVGTLSSVAFVRLAATVVQGLRLSTLMGHMAAATAVTVIAVAASVAPAMNAAKVDPGSVLRDE
jgi:ABC-type antimicrobial peptide transport system permease subunit